MTTEEQHKEWCRVHFALMAERGVWGVPRSGLTFQKQGDKLVLVSKVSPITPTFAQFQEDDYEVIRDQFNEAGIKVVKSDEMS